jgi:hypothetical protein
MTDGLPEGSSLNKGASPLAGAMVGAAADGALDAIDPAAQPLTTAAADTHASAAVRQRRPGRERFMREN